LYYKDLSEHIRRFRAERERIFNDVDAHRVHVGLGKFNGRLSPNELKPVVVVVVNRKLYKKNVLNRWHLLLRLAVNPELLKYRKQLYRPNRKYESHNKCVRVAHNLAQTGKNLFSH
jgi:hypothetical protein